MKISKYLPQIGHFSKINWKYFKRRVSIPDTRLHLDLLLRNQKIKQDASKSNFYIKQCLIQLFSLEFEIFSKKQNDSHDFASYYRSLQELKLRLLEQLPNFKHKKLILEEQVQQKLDDVLIFKTQQQSSLSESYLEII